MKNYLGYIYAIISASTFGLIPMFSIPAINAGMSVNSALFYRYLISTIILGTFLLITKKNVRVKREELTTLAGLILLGGTTALFLMNSFYYIPSGVASTIHFLYPVVVAMLMTILFKEKFSPFTLVAIILALLGVAAISGLSSSLEVNTTGLTYALLSVVTYALYIVGINKSKAGRMSPTSMTLYIMIMLTFFFLILSITEGGVQVIPNREVLGSLTLLSLVSTLLSNFTLILAIKSIGSTTTSIMGCVEPVTALTVGIIVFGEPLTTTQILGVALILTSVSFVILSNRLSKRLKAIATRFSTN
ncbi:MAG: DMT family transporter [Bacteroidales bacterium]